MSRVGSHINGLLTAELEGQGCGTHVSTQLGLVISRVEVVKLSNTL